MSERRHMLLAWALLVTVVLTFAAGAWLPAWEALERNRGQIVDVRARLEKVHGLATTRNELVARIAALQRAPDERQSQRFFAARTTALGVADLQQRVLAVITRNAGHQVSSQPLAGKRSGEFHKLTVTVTFDADLATLQGVLYDFENSAPRIFVEQIIVTARDSAGRTDGRQPRGRRSHSLSPGLLSARLVLAGYMPVRGSTDET